MEDFAIRVSGLSKKYSITSNKSTQNLSERLHLKFLFRQNKNKHSVSEFYALKDINFEIKKKEIIGIIGSNGAGKSTLLKILSEVTEPTEGKIEINGKIASVLEIGMGFHPELTGRDNIYFSGTMLGLSKKYINSKFDEIVSFSGVERFIDTPVKHYSSGMYMRLAFSVVANIDADILLFDEILNLGDASFRAKCEKKIFSLISEGKTILMVSHNFNEIYKLCEKVMYLENGELQNFSDKSIINHYLKKVFNKENLEGYLDRNSITYNINKIIEVGKEKYCKLNTLSFSSKGEKNTGNITYRDCFHIEILLEKYSDYTLNFGFVIKRYDNQILEFGNTFNDGYIDTSEYENKNISVLFQLPRGIFLEDGSYVLCLYATDVHKTVIYNNEFQFAIENDITGTTDESGIETFSNAIKLVSEVRVLNHNE